MATLLQIHEPGETPVPHLDDGNLAVGIDLGTTNSLVGISTDGNAEVLRDENGKGLVPSVVAYAPDGSAIVGDLARGLLLDQPDRVVSSIKRLMGRGIEDVKSLAGTLPFEISATDQDGGGMVRINIAGKTMSPVEISADILRALKIRAQDHTGKAVDKAVITVPAYFDDAARTATKDAARLAGIDVLRLVNEPTAAALAYGLDKGAEGLFAVFDLGGGTFDVSLLRMETGVFQVLATGGDAALGGDDFDHVIAEYFLAQRVDESGPEKLTAAEVKTSLITARLAKECLTANETGDWIVDVGAKQTRHVLDRQTLDRLIAPMVARTIEICEHVLEDAGVTPDQIKGVVLVGGSTRVPLVRRQVAKLFGTEPLSDINPDEVVTLGAALQAEALTVGSDTLLLDVTPLSLGIETMGGMVEKIIPRNTPIPVAKAQEFTTYQDGQTALSIRILQGEREMVDQCRSLARFELHGLPPMTAGAARIKVTFTVDADGLLTVSATEDTTGIVAQVEVKPSYGLSEDEMATMLRDSMVNAREDMDLRLLAESRMEAGRNLAAVESALAVDGELLDETEKSQINAAMQAVQVAIKADDRDAINDAAKGLEVASRSFAEKRMDRGIRAALKGSDVEALEDRVESAREGVA